MSDYKLICYDEKRRRQVRKQGLNGLDYLEVNDDQTKLAVYFINRAPQELTKGNFRIEGGERIRGIDVINVEYGCSDEPDPTVDVCVQLTVNKPGDFSTYRLCWVEKDAYDRATKTRAKDADPIYACLEFSFKVGCPNGLDCGDIYSDKSYSPPKIEEAEINYLAKDYASFRQLILDRLALVMPNWKERHVPDIGMALVEVLAYTGDYLSYYQDAVATEAYLETARQRISVRRHARLVDYLMHEGCNARAWLCVDPDEGFDVSMPGKVYFITGFNDRLRIEGGTIKPDQLLSIPANMYEVFHPIMSEATKQILFVSHREIQFYTWGNQQCCLPKGTTRATLLGRLDGEAWKQQKRDSINPFLAVLPTDGLGLFKDLPEDTERKDRLEVLISLDDKTLFERLNTAIVKFQEQYLTSVPEETQRLLELLKCLNTSSHNRPTLHLKKGAVLIFEEIVGPETSNKADADPSHRQAVRLTIVEAGVDPAYDHQPVVEIEWAAEDALTFPLCLSAIGPSPECKLLENISVARGNVILVDHGRWVEQSEPLGRVPVLRSSVSCEGVEDPTDITVEVGKLKPPRLKWTPMTHCQLLPAEDTPASQMLMQDPRRALPVVNLTAKDQTVPGFPPKEAGLWQPQRDLLDSGPLDSHFVVEIDNDERGHIRFGDGVHGRMPKPDEPELYASYRFGTGTSGNVGAEAINIVVTDANTRLQVRNPMPAQGGVFPETMESVKLFAPGAFRSELMRAITPEDYVWLAERYPDGREASWRTVVQRAAAAACWTGSEFEILLAIDPLTEPLRVPHEDTAELLTKIETYIQCYRRIGHDVRVEFAHYVPLDIELCVTLLPGYFKGHVKAELMNIFSNRQLPNGRLAFFHPDNLTFGEGIYLSKLVSTAQAVTGVESAWVTRLQRMSEPEPEPNQESSAISEGLLRLSPLEIARVDNDPSQPEHGRITFSLEGG